MPAFVPVFSPDRSRRVLVPSTLIARESSNTCVPVNRKLVEIKKNVLHARLNINSKLIFWEIICQHFVQKTSLESSRQDFASVGNDKREKKYKLVHMVSTFISMEKAHLRQGLADVGLINLPGWIIHV